MSATIQNTGAKVQNTSAKVANTSARVANTGATIQNTSARVANTGAKVANTGAKVANTGAKVQNTGARVANMSAIVQNMCAKVPQASAKAAHTSAKIAQASGVRRAPSARLWIFPPRCGILPRERHDDMITLKFGGASLGSAERILESARIMLRRAAEDRVSVVVSAVAGVSNSLQQSIDRCVTPSAGIENAHIGAAHLRYAEALAAVHEEICRNLERSVGGFRAEPVLKKLAPLFAEYGGLLEAVHAIGECPASVQCRIMGLGERLCVPIVEATLSALLPGGQRALALDSRDFIYATGRQTEGDVDYAKTGAALAPYRRGEKGGEARILLFPGFICAWGRDEPGLLGRNGSDFSAALIGWALDARRVEFWTDVGGIFAADPRIVPDAVIVDDLSYEEAMELSFFGSKVLHPKTLAPLAEKGIEAWSLNSRDPSCRGTRIGKRTAGSGKDAAEAVRGISCLKNVAVVSVSGPGMKGRSGMAARTFSAVSRAGISVLLITQSSSEYTLSFCIDERYSRAVSAALEGEFELEIRERLVNPVEVRGDNAVVSIVGDNMKQKRGVAATFFSALASSDINIHAIAQGSSERSISAVTAGEEGDTAVRVAHRFFFHTAQTIEAFVFGVGAIGGCLVDQIRSQLPGLAAQNIDVRVLGIARSGRMLLSAGGEALDLSAWRDALDASETPASLDAVLNFVRTHKPLNPVFVDCTASDGLPERYLDIFKAGMHITTPNKRANSMPMSYYRALRETANGSRRRFLYETNVGAGLPIIDTLQNLFKSGDRLTSFQGIMSGSLSYIFGRLDEGAAFSEAVREAREKRYTEPDPREDLSGMDVARKALIIAREAGLSLELSEVAVSKAFPPDFDDSGDVEMFLRNLPKADAYFAGYIARLRREGKALRMGASIADGRCSVGALEVAASHPLYAVKGGENAFVFTTTRYQPIPLSVRGYGAGAAVTAAGVFGDMLRTVSWNLALPVPPAGNG
ncbi:bifunctional aspartate kinase/homoserine dehydrogenase I [Treponema endosymbiont of Eucomonympha sp.]|uniref:bifunctional aspartate kinase/homoserine dehydrogenase I n=1 Tax=Treponema endosymbiont of Eucomonympha sp. TaxID=1580831 RepID=UPI000A4858AE|nr:bifunctional aspartate kinase/homoserine dehydrogenase I [Treponema endosymbiont of Eucomonympha sp.]